MLGRELLFSCKDRNTKQAWVEHLRRRITYTPATPDERRLVRETLSRASSKFTVKLYRGFNETSCL